MTAVAITPRSFRSTSGAHHERVRAAGFDVRFPSHDRPLREDEMVELIRGCEGLIVGVDDVTDRVLAAGPLRVVVKYGTGLDNIDLAAAARRGVRVAATPGANARSVAELALALILALARHVVAHDAAVRRGEWAARRMGAELAGKRLGLVGFGAVARELAQIARALDMGVVAHDPYVADADVDLVALEELLAECDVVSLHLPLTDDTRLLLDERRLRLMRPGSFLVNTARGGLVDETALAEALRSGHLGGAAFDAFTEEPLPPTSPLLALDTFVSSPHAGSATREAAARMSLRALDLLVEAL